MHGRDPDRIMLALACGAAGFLFGALMDAYQWTLAAEHTLSSYLAVSGTSLTFNIAHAVGNVVFALILGPAFVRALERYRRRFQVRWLAVAPRLAMVFLAFAVLSSARPALAADPPSDVAPVIARAERYLRQAQNPDGGFGAAPKAGSTQLHTGWTALGLASAGRNPLDVSQKGHSVIDYVNAHATQLNDVGELERTMLVLRAAGMPQRLGGRNLLVALLKKRKADGSFGTINHTAFGVLALRAAGRGTRSKEVRAAVHVLLRAQNNDGGFGFSKSAGSDIDDTAAVIQALVAGGRRSAPVVKRAVRYLRKAQRPDGGFGQMPTATSNAQSTAFAVQGLVAAGVNPRKVKRTRTPIEFLKSLQGADGSIRYSRTSTQTPIWVTAQALNGLEAKPYPLRPAARQKARTARAASSGGVRSGPTATTATKSSRTRRAARPKAHTAIPPANGGVASPQTTAPKSTPRAQLTGELASVKTPAASDPPVKRDKEWWAYVFAVLIGVAMVAGLRLAWRRG
jgi:energy-coupling factor transport system substrate-specific component